MVANSTNSIGQLRGIALAVAMLLWISNGRTCAEELSEPFADVSIEQLEENWELSDPEAAEFDAWENLVENKPTPDWDRADLRPFDWMRHVGFRHSSTHGRYVDRGNPMEGTSWKNRPYHVDWFVGSLLGDELINNRVKQDNVLMGGLRIGWDFDYYWGIEWRAGWARPDAQFDTPQTDANRESYFISDVDLVYYPWGDSKIRPYWLTGFGFARIDFLDDVGINHHATLATLPFGAGVQFHQHPWLVWRLEVLDNLSLGADGISTMHNVSFTGGMELRFGARPASYWPWRSSRSIW